MDGSGAPHPKTPGRGYFLPSELAGTSLVFPGSLLTVKTLKAGPSVTGEKFAAASADDDELVFPPSRLELAPVRRGILRATWNNNADDASSVELNVTKVRTEEGFWRTLPDDQSSIELEVAPGERYCVFVRAKAVRGWFGTFIARHEEVSTLARNVGSRYCATAPE